MIAAILRAQALSMRMAARRGAAVSLAIGILWYAMWCAIAWAMLVAAASAAPEELRAYMGLGLLGIFVYWQLVPVVSASLGSSLDLHKLLAYPIPHRKLFLVEVLLRLTTGGEALMVLAGGMAGVLANPAVGSTAWPRVMAAALLFVAFNLLLASGARSLLERLLSRPRVREALTLAMVILWVLPRLVMVNDHRPAWLHLGTEVVTAPFWPWSSVGRMALGEGSAGFALLLMLGWVAAVGWFGFSQFERGLRFDPAAAQAANPDAGKRTAGIMERFYTLPRLLCRDPLAAMVEKELRSLARSPRFRTVFMMGFTFGILVWMPLTLGRRGASAEVGTYFVTLVSLYAVMLLGQVSYLNCFGLDRSGAQIYFAVPHSLGMALVSKNLACAMYIYLEVLLLSAITVTLGMVAGWGVLVENAVAVGIASTYLLAMGNLSSVYYPRAMKPEKVARGGAASRFQALVFVLFPLALLPLGAAYAVRSLSGSELLFGLMLSLAALIGIVLYGVALDSAVHAAKRRREMLIGELSRGEGPVASD